MNNIIYPIRFRKNICIHCGKEGTLLFKDKFDNTTRNPIYTVNNLICSNCNTVYFIKWEKLETDEKMVPTCCSNLSIQEFENEIIEYSLSNKRKLL